MSIRYATSSENVGVKLYVDDKAVLEEVAFPKGEGWDTYSVHEAGKVSLSAGKHVLKLEIVGDYVNIDWLDFADSKTTAVKGARVLPLVTQRRAAYSVFDTQGRFVASFTAVGDEEARVKVYAAVKHAGSYLVKPQSGGRMFRMSVK